MKKFILAAFMALSVLFIPLNGALATSSGYKACDKMIQKSSLCSNGGDMKNIVSNVLRTLFFILGVLAVIMIIYAGIQYVISAGDSGKVTKAKNTIIYSVVGLVVAIMAYAIVGYIAGVLK